MLFNDLKCLDFDIVTDFSEFPSYTCNKNMWSKILHMI